MMLSTTLIVFRETLEAALFVGIVAAATAHLAHFGRWLAWGVGSGVLGSIVLAAALSAVAEAVDGRGQDLLSLGLLGLAWMVLVWHITQAPHHARHRVAQAQRLGATARADVRSMGALTLAVGVAVLREGAETVLFVAGVAHSGSSAWLSDAWGVVMGVALGVGVGWLLQRGLRRLRPQQLFVITNGWMVLLAGALASQWVMVLIQAYGCTMLTEQAWDVSAVVPNASVVGMLLQGLVGYDDSPSQAQVWAYVLTIIGIVSVLWAGRTRPQTVRGLGVIVPSGAVRRA